MKKTYVISAKRSAIGSFLGSLATVKPAVLGSTVVKALLEDAKVAPENVDELICGNVLGAGLGQNIARTVALEAGIPETVCSHSVNMVCGSGLRTVMEGVMSDPRQTTRSSFTRIKFKLSRFEGTVKENSIYLLICIYATISCFYQTQK